MSNTEMKSISCPKCNRVNEVRVFKTVNSTTDPQFRESLLSGQMFNFQCVGCGYEATLKYPVLYNDMKHRFMVYYIPENDRAEIVDKELESEYSDLGNIKKRLADSFNVMKEKIHIFESGLDDRAIEVTKLAVAEIVAKKTGESVNEGYFSIYNKEEDTIGFTFFIGENNEQFVQITRLEIYQKSVEIVNKVDGNSKTDAFVTVDKAWAENVLYRYKKQM